MGYCVPRMPHSYTYTLLYLSAQDLERCFGITLSYDEETDTYVYKGSFSQTQEA